MDFAFSVHTDVGLRCAGAKVNGRLVPLESKLNNGDVVEIVTNKERTQDLAVIGLISLRAHVHDQR